MVLLDSLLAFRVADIRVGMMDDIDRQGRAGR